MKSKDSETAKALKEQLQSCFKYFDDESINYNGLINHLEIYYIANFINKELYWRYDFISNYEYLSNSELLSQKLKDLIVNHTQFLLNNISDKLSAENVLKSVINEITNNSFEKDIKQLKKEI